MPLSRVPSPEVPGLAGLVVVRPIVKYASTLWDASGAGLALLEQVQTQVLRRVLRAPGTVADYVLRMEVGCRSFISWMDQPKLESKRDMRVTRRSSKSTMYRLLSIWASLSCTPMHASSTWWARYWRAST
jgi:hypothetical protein